MKMKEDDLFGNSEPSQVESDTDNTYLLTGTPPGICGVAVISNNCIALSTGSATRIVNIGTLIQVWSMYDKIRFSVANESNNAITMDPCCLVCNSNDILRVEPKLWGALFPLRKDLRVAIAKDQAYSQRLATIDIGSSVEVIGVNSEFLADATVVFRNELHINHPGVYFGLKLWGDPEANKAVAEAVSVIRPSNPCFPAGCDVVVTLQHLRPILGDSRDNLIPKLLPPSTAETQTFRSTLVLERDDCQGWMPKSASQHSLRSTEVAIRRQATRSLDLTNSVSKPRIEEPKHLRNNLELPLPLSKNQASRSLDLPQTSNRRLMRGRACASLDSDPPVKTNVGDIEENFDDELTVGSLIEFHMHGLPYFGVIRWIGRLPDSGSQRMAGVEMEEELDLDDEVETHGLFVCPPYKALFVPLSKLKRDSRFLEGARRKVAPALSTFGQIECPVVKGIIPPISVELKNICGKNRGIQGHHNSCYLDATLFAMFAFTSVFDSLLYRPPRNTDIPQYEDVQKVLRDEIVNPLRRNLYVRADRVMKLRTLLEQLSSVTGLTSEEKDPEEFLNSLLAQILKADPFLQLSSGQEAFHYQLFVEKDEHINVPSVQQLLEQSFLVSKIKLKELPSCLIVQMPRFGKAFKMYSRILPSTVLDVTDVIENSPRQCTVCGKLAEVECRECYLSGLEGCSFCVRCLETAHSHPSRSRHVARALAIPVEFQELKEHCAVPRLAMHLFAVVCIETSHYVAFLNTERGWVFFDSMADRKGEQNGYNIPEIVRCPDLPFWLSEEGARKLEEIQDERQLPEPEKRLLCDAYMCMYQSPDVMMYR